MWLAGGCFALGCLDNGGKRKKVSWKLELEEVFLFHCVNSPVKLEVESGVGGSRVVAQVAPVEHGADVVMSGGPPLMARTSAWLNSNLVFSRRRKRLGQVDLIELQVVSGLLGW